MGQHLRYTASLGHEIRNKVTSWVVGAWVEKNDGSFRGGIQIFHESFEIQSLLKRIEISLLRTEDKYLSLRVIVGEFFPIQEAILSKSLMGRPCWGGDVNCSVTEVFLEEGHSESDGTGSRESL